MSLQKPSATDRKLARRRDRLDLKKDERDNKAGVRQRDKFCRFPLCGCRKLGLILKAIGEVSHQRHKGMGGNPAGDRSQVAGMVLLCKHRHQDGRISIHKGTLRPVFLTPDQFNGLIAWEIDLSALGFRTQHELALWREVARETAVQQWAISSSQRDTLQQLAEMTV